MSAGGSPDIFIEYLKEDYLTDYSSKLRQDYGEVEGEERPALHKEAWQVIIMILMTMMILRTLMILRTKTIMAMITKRAQSKMTIDRAFNCQKPNNKGPNV